MHGRLAGTSGKTLRELASVRLNEESVAKSSISLLYDALNRAKFNRTFSKWRTSFSEIHGLFDTQRKVDIATLARLYKTEARTTQQLFTLIFALETYYSIILRFIGYKALIDEPLSLSNAIPLMRGDYFEAMGIFNYRCDEIYNWFLELDVSNLSSLLRPIIEILNVDDLVFDGDCLRRIHELIFPRTLRHSMGEFYTPNWLVTLVNRTLLEHEDEPWRRTFLDPTCGSGSFLANIVENHVSKHPEIVDRVFGVDLNPLAGLCARTNLILAARSEIGKRRPYVLPIFNQDILDNPFDSYGHTLDQDNSRAKVRLDDRMVMLPRVALRYDEISHVYVALKSGQQGKRLTESEVALYEVLSGLALSESEKDTVLSHYATHALCDVDYVVGNPPWVNWEYLPKEYRSKTVQKWQYYGLFDLKGIDSAFVKEDISSLITYAVIDKHLRKDGRLGFVIKETLFKSSKQGNGFRKFYLDPSSLPLEVLQVHDLTRVRPFPELTNRTAILFLRKGRETRYPVPYYVWESKSKIRNVIDSSRALDDVLETISIKKEYARPSNPRIDVSGWISLPKELIDVSNKVLGVSHYRARTGVFSGGANAVYWLSIITAGDNDVVITNETDSARNKVMKGTFHVEKTHLYPLIRGRDLGFWEYSYSKYVLCPHTKDTKMYPLPIAELRTKTPKTLAYLARFKSFLEKRKGFAQWERSILENNFYAIQRIGAYTFEEYKVAWPFISQKFRVAVVEPATDRYLGNRIIMPNEKIMYVGLSDRQEAYFLCGLLSSDIYRAIIEGYMVETQIGPSILNNLNIPKYDKRNEYHKKIGDLCQKGHRQREKQAILDALNKVVMEMIGSG